jgi:hypothetical protein
MPSNWGQSGYKHKDHELQREIERVGKSFHSLDKDVAQINNQIGGMSKSLAQWELQILHNMNLVTKPTYQLNFSDDGDVRFEVQQTDKNQATVRAYLDIEAEIALDKYKTSWELREHVDYTVLSAIETVPTAITEPLNQSPQNTHWDYPQANAGDGWIPFSCDKEVVEDVNSYIYSNPVIYSGLRTKNVFVFKPEVTGIYRINALLYIKAIMTDSLATAARWYDSIDKGMLIIEKFNYDSVFGTSPTFTTTWNPVKNVPIAIGSKTDHDHTYAILDMKSRHGDVDSSRNFTATPISTYYANNDEGTPYGLTYDRDIQLGNSVNMAFEEGDCCVIWYKLYGRRLKIDSAVYVDMFPALFHIEDRSERVDIEYVAPLGANDEIDKQSVIEIVRRF